jgi:two-component system sensor histidine kinase ChiS
MAFRRLTTLQSKIGNSLVGGMFRRLNDQMRDRASHTRLRDRKIGQKLNIGFGVLVVMTFLLVGRNYLGGRKAEVNINRTQELRVPTALTSAQAQEDLLKMLSNVRAYLATGEPEYRYGYQQARQSFEANLAEMETLLKRGTSPKNHQRLEQLKANYEQWTELPEQLIALKDDLLDNQPALKILDGEGQRPIIVIQREIAEMLNEQEQRSPSAQNMVLLRDMAEFQSSFALLVSSLQSYLVTRSPSFRFEYNARAQENKNVWKELVAQRQLLTTAQQSRLDEIAKQRQAFLALPERMFNVVEGNQYRQDLFLFRKEAEPLAESMLRLLEEIVADQQSILKLELLAGRQGLSQAQWQTLLGGIVALLLGIGMAIALQRQIANPIKRLTNVTTRIRAGDLDAKAPVESADEVGELAIAFNSMAEQLKASFAELEKQNEDLKHLDQLKNEFLANTSHELRTPLNGIIGIAESLIDGATGELSQATQANLTLIISSGRRLANLVNDILDFSKLRHKNLELQLKPVDLRAVTHVVLTLSQPLAANKRLKLLNTIPAELPPAEADENRLQQILHNLIANAIKFTPSGTVEVKAEVVTGNGQKVMINEQSPITDYPVPEPVEGLPITQYQLAITVSDTGIGIPEDKFDRIFESFEQAEGSTAREYGGTGLGLAVTKQLVQLHGGEISVKSQVGEGSQFTFTLPISQGNLESSQQIVAIQDTQELELATSITSRNSPSTINNAKQFKVLIVDDEPVNRQVLINNLSLYNYAITEASNGQEALAVIEKGLIPDLILLDVMMPHMTGYEVCQKIRDRFPAHELPIVMLTAKNQVADIVEGFESGANDYLSKPIQKQEMLARIKTHLYLAKLTLAYERFVPHNFLKFLEKESIIDVQLGDQVQQKMTVMFSDIRSFTTLSESISPQETFNFINSYLSRVSPLIRQHKGFIDKYIGDAVMALFPESADDAVQAAIGMHKEVALYNKHRENYGYAPISIGIGLHTGNLMLGTIGESERMETTVIADAVNLASRLEGLTKLYGVGILISEHTLSQLSELQNYSYRFLDRVRVKGKDKPVSIYEVYDEELELITEVKTKTRALFEQAVLDSSHQDFAKAQQMLQEILAMNPQDKAAMLYVKRCQQYQQYGVPEGWEGVTDLDFK